MAITTKTITGTIVAPGTTTGIRGVLTATPATTGTALTFPADNIVSLGPVTATTDSAGVLPPSFKIPTSSAQGGLLWQFTFKPSNRRDGLPLSWVMGYYEITGTGTIDIADLVAVDVTAVTPTLLDTVASYTTRAENAAAAAEAVGNTNDTIMAGVVNDSASATNTALSTAYTRRRDYDPRNYGTFTEAATWQQNRDALQGANDAAYAAGGGRVVIPPGSYQCKGVIQDSRVEFYGPMAKLIHPDGDSIDIIAARVTSTTGSIVGGSTTLNVADATGIEKGAVIGIRAAGGISRLQNAGMGSAITSAQTTGITLGDSTGFATSGYLWCDSEVIGYTGLTGNTLTGVTRGEFGTTPAAHAAGAQTGTALRHMAIVQSVSGTTVTLSAPAPRGVNSAAVSTGAVRPKISHLSFNGSRINGGASTTVNPIRWDLVRWGSIEWLYVEDAEAAFYMAQGTSDCAISHVVARNCSVPEASKGAVAWFFQQCQRNRLEDIKIYEGCWAGIYFDNRTSLGTEWDGGCNDNTVDGYNISTPYLGSSITNTGVLIVGGSRNEISNGHVDGVRTGFTIDNTAQVHNTDAYLPSSTGNTINRLKQINGYQPYAILAGANTVSGLAYDTAANGSDTSGQTFYIGSAIAPGGPPILGRSTDGTQTAPGMAFAAETNTGFYRIAAGQVQYVSQGTLGLRLTSTGFRVTDTSTAALLDLGTTNGTKIGTGTTQKLGFYGVTPVVRPSGTPAAATDLATALTLVNDLRTKLIALGLIS